MIRRVLIVPLALALLALAAVPTALGRASTQIDVPVTVPKAGNITVATAHVKLNKASGGNLKVTLKKGKRLGGGVSLYARPRKQGRNVTVYLVITHKGGKSSAHAAASTIATLTTPTPDGFARSFKADEQPNLFDLPGGSKPEGKICDGKGSGTSRLIAGRHVFNSTDAGQVIKDACSAFNGSRSGGAAKLQKAL